MILTSEEIEVLANYFRMSNKIERMVMFILIYAFLSYENKFSLCTIEMGYMSCSLTTGKCYLLLQPQILIYLNHKKTTILLIMVMDLCFSENKHFILLDKYKYSPKDSFFHLLHLVVQFYNILFQSNANYES